MGTWFFMIVMVTQGGHLTHGITLEHFSMSKTTANLVVYRAGSQTETADNALWASGSNDIPGPGTLPLNLNNTPTDWKQAATPYVPMVPQAFASQGINIAMCSLMLVQQYLTSQAGILMP